MDTEIFQEILIKSVGTQIKVIVSLFLIIFFFLLIDIAFLVFNKSGKGISLWTLLPFNKHYDTKLTVKEQIILKILAIIVLLFVCAWKIIPVYDDITHHQYAYVYAEYSRTPESSEAEGFFSNGCVFLTVNGEKIRLQLPSDWSSDTFPEGIFKGYSWYSESSKYILSFEPVP